MSNSQFSYAQYQEVVERAQANSSGNNVKVGYFKLKDDGDIAIARINYSSTDDFNFAAVHTVSTGGRWLKVACHNPIGNGGHCPLCEAHLNNPKGAIGKASKKMFIPMLVSYRDPASATGYTAPIPVIWDRPALFSRELANKLMIAGDLRNTLVMITRNGKAGDMQTTYSVDILPENHPVFKPDMIPADFSAFDNFDITRHSYYEKTEADIEAFLATGKFPEAVRVQTPQAVPTTPVTQAATAATSVAQVANAFGVTNTAPAASTTAVPTRDFSGFNF